MNKKPLNEPCKLKTLGLQETVTAAASTIWGLWDASAILTSSTP